MAEPKRTTSKDDSERFLLRLPKGLRDRIKLLAAEKKNSMNAQCVLMLESYLHLLDLDKSSTEDSWGGYEADYVSQGVANSLRSQELNDLKEQIAQALGFLRNFVAKQNLWCSSLETKRLTIQLALWKQDEISAQSIIEHSDLAKVEADLENAYQDLKEALKLLHVLHPFDPAQVKHWTIEEGCSVPSVGISFNVTRQIERGLEQNFNEIANSIIDVHSLAKKVNDNLYKKG